MILKCYKPRKQVLLSGNLSEIGGVFLLNIRTTKA